MLGPTQPTDGKALNRRLGAFHGAEDLVASRGAPSDGAGRRDVPNDDNGWSMEQQHSRRRCPEGHAAPGTSRFCPECGRRMEPEPGWGTAPPVPEPRGDEETDGRHRPGVAILGAFIGLAVLVVFAIILQAQSGQSPASTPEPQSSSYAPTPTERCTAVVRAYGAAVLEAGASNAAREAVINEAIVELGSQSAEYQVLQQVQGEATGEMFRNGRQSALRLLDTSSALKCEEAYPPDYGIEEPEFGTD